jgi:hypothetical protein
MSEFCRLIWHAFVGLFRSRAALEAEILVLRHQLNVLRRKSPSRMAFSGLDRVVFAGLYALAPHYSERAENRQTGNGGALASGWLPCLLAVEIATAKWSAEYSLGNSPLIREMSVANPLWGAPRIHGELLKLGIDVGLTSVAKYMAKGRRRPPSQGSTTRSRDDVRHRGTVIAFMGIANGAPVKSRQCLSLNLDVLR